MVDIYKWLLVLSTVVISAADVCYNNNGAFDTLTVECPAGCCGKGQNPCCPVSDSIFLFAVGTIASVSLIAVCVLIFCIHKIHTKKLAMARQQEICEKQREDMLSELYTACNQYHIVVFNANRNKDKIKQLELPPRYSEIYAAVGSQEKAPKTSLSDDTLSIRSSRLSLFGSIKRTSFFKRSFRPGRNSESVELHHQHLSAESPGQETCNKKPILSDVSRCTSPSNSSHNCSTNSSTESVRDIDLSDPSSLMASIAENLPDIFESTQE